MAEDDVTRSLSRLAAPRVQEMDEKSAERQRIPLAVTGTIG
jgi:hypothetical protein